MGMTIFTRYVLAELAKIFLTTLVAMTLMMIIIGVVAEATKQGLGPTQIVRLLPYILPNSLVFTIPGTALFAVSLVYGRMSSSNEIVALKSAGVSPLAVLWPAIIISTLLSFATVWLNDVAVSWGTQGVQRVVIESVEEIIYGMLRTQRAYSTKEISINVKGVDGKKLIRPTVVLPQKDSRPALTIMAEWAEMRSDFDEGMLRIAFHDFHVLGEGSITAQNPDTQEIAIPLFSASRADQRTVVPARMALRDIPSRKAKHLKRIANWRRDISFHAATDFLTGDFAELASDDWKVRTDVIRWDLGDLHRFETEPQRRWANGFSCLAFVLVGAPLAIRRRNADVLTSFFLCFLPILIFYYPLLIFGLNGAKEGTLWPCSVWLGNAIMGIWGLRQMCWVLRY
jgi:lipopolysaccharide export system permease protein